MTCSTDILVYWVIGAAIGLVFVIALNIAIAWWVNR